jgi:hypothetical protein
LESRVGINSKIGPGKELGDVEAGDVTIVCSDDGRKDEGGERGNGDGKLHAGRVGMG